MSMSEVSGNIFGGAYEVLKSICAGVGMQKTQTSI